MEKPKSFHESYADPFEVKGSSDRSFGFVFAIVFFIIGLWPLKGGEPVRWWALAIGGVFGALALLRPNALSLPNRLWFLLGLLLQKITHPIIMGILFYGVIAPTGILMRLLKNDILRLKWEKEASSYWIARNPPGPPPETLRNQF